MSSLAERQLAERRLKQFERNILSAATAMGLDRPQETAEATMHLARHAALAVAFDPGLLHLLRINFFIDRDRLPYWVEARLLLSPLCRDAEGSGLYVMDAPLRDLLLLQFTQTEGGPERMREVATLLWQYTERRSAWMDRQELRHAQQLTALNFLAPERAMAWLNEAEQGSGADSLPKEWFVAMRGELPSLPLIQLKGDPAVVCEALLELDFSAQRTAHRDTLRLPAAKIYVLGGPRVFALPWLLLRLLKQRDVSPSLLESTATAGSPSVQRSLATAMGLTPDASWPAMRERTAALAQAGPLAIAVHGAQHLDAAQQTGLQRLVNGGLPVWLYALDDGENPRALFGSQTRSAGSDADLQVVYLPPIEPMTASDLQDWIDRYGPQAGFDRGKGTAAPSAAEACVQIVTATGGIPQFVLEALCVRCGVRWYDVWTHAEARFSAQLPQPDDPVAELAQTYQTRRAGMKPGSARTRAMEEVVGRMRTLLATRTDWALPKWIESKSAGMRLAAAVLLQLQPQSAYCAWLGTRVKNETPFIAYHALRALMTAATQLPVAELEAVSLALAQANADLSPLDAHTDRADLLALTQKILFERRPYARTYLPMLPLSDNVIFPAQAVDVDLDSPEAIAGLAKLMNGGDGTVFARYESNAGGSPDTQLTGRVGTITVAKNVRKSGEGFRVSLEGVRRAAGQPAKAIDAARSALFEITSLPDIADEAVSSGERAELSNALRALARIGGVRSTLVSELASGPVVGLCYRLADELPLTLPEQQRLLDQDDARQMLRQLVTAVFARIEAALPESLGKDDWGTERLVAILSGAFVDPEDRALLTSAFDVNGTGPNPIRSLIEATASDGRLRAVAAHALGRRPDNEALWEHIEAMGALPEQSAVKLPLASSRAVSLKLWPNGSTLRIRFMGGSAKLHERVMQCAKQWFEHANLRFRVLTPQDKTRADIRISFHTSTGNWSYLGTDASQIPVDQATMNLGHLTLSTPAAEFQAAVLKDFGHALGLLQEHQNPNSRIPWDREAVIKAMTAPPSGWTQKDVEENVLTRAPQTSPRYRDFDSQSVMLHNFEAELLSSQTPLRGGTELSASDKQFIARLYPRAPDGATGRAQRSAPPTKARRSA